jgi:hypothetical protein
LCRRDVFENAGMFIYSGPSNSAELPPKFRIYHTIDLSALISGKFLESNEPPESLKHVSRVDERTPFSRHALTSRDHRTVPEQNRE